MPHIAAAAAALTSSPKLWHWTSNFNKAWEENGMSVMSDKTLFRKATLWNNSEILSDHFWQLNLQKLIFVSTNTIIKQILVLVLLNFKDHSTAYLLILVLKYHCPACFGHFPATTYLIQMNWSPHMLSMKVCTSLSMTQVRWNKLPSKTCRTADFEDWIWQLLSKTCRGVVLEDKDWETLIYTYTLLSKFGPSWYWSSKDGDWQ